METDVMFERDITEAAFRLIECSMAEGDTEIVGTVGTLRDVVLDVHVAHLVAFL